MGQRPGARSVIRKIVVTSLSGALSFPLTNLLFDSAAQQLAMSAAVGAVALVVQLLVEVEQRLSAVETGQDEQADEVRHVVAAGFQKVSTATEMFGRIEATELSSSGFADLAGKAAAIGPGAPPLIVAFAQSEIDRVTELLGALAGSEVTREGEDRDHLLTLTRLARTGIDATSLFAVDGGGLSGESGFWNSDLGQSYLELQHQAVRRGVRVRRIFIVENEELATRPQFELLCRSQRECGIDVRILVPSRLSRRRTFRDYVLFDDTISYEVVPCVRVTSDTAGPQIQSTSLASKCPQVNNLVEDYARLWEAATPAAVIAPRDPVASAAGPHLDRDSPAVAP
ncbi:MAG: DUF6879 family protein [Kibdelosporangium sp.]